MTNLQKGLVAGAVVVVLGAIVAASVYSKTKETGTEVYFGKAETRDLASVVTATGQIQARTKVNVQSSVIGEIGELPVKEGHVVRKGDLRVQIDPERYRSEVARLAANLRVQEIALGQARLDYAELYDKWMGPKGLVPFPMSQAYKDYLQLIVYPMDEGWLKKK